MKKIFLIILIATLPFLGFSQPKNNAVFTNQSKMTLSLFDSGGLNDELPESFSRGCLYLKVENDKQLRVIIKSESGKILLKGLTENFYLTDRLLSIEFKPYGNVSDLLYTVVFDITYDDIERFENFQKQIPVMKE